MSTMEYPKVQQFIRSRIGTSETRLSHHVVDSSIGLFMNRWNCPDEETLLKLIEKDEEAYADLIHRTTVKETYFYREPQVLSFALSQELPRILARKKHVSILSAGCSTGAEPYSIAIAIDDRFGRGVLDSCSIHGIDVDPKAIAIAREGIYTRHAMRGVPLNIQKDYLKQESGSSFYHVEPHIRQHVSFSVANLIDTDQIAGLQKFDIIFYRNVSIYFDEEQRDAIFESLADRLHEGGRLFTSSSETLPHDIGILRLDQSSGVFYFSKESNHQSPERRSDVRSVKERLENQVRQAPGKERTVRRERPRPVKKKQDTQPAATVRPVEQVALDQARSGSLPGALQFIGSFPEDHPAVDRLSIVKAGILFEQNHRDEARALCENLIAKDPMLVEPHIILSMIQKLEGEYDAAIRELKTALYLDAECWIALYYSADLYMHSGETNLAKRNFQRVIEVLEAEHITDYLLIFTVNEQTATQIARLCRYSLAQIDQ